MAQFVKVGTKADFEGFEAGKLVEAEKYFSDAVKLFPYSSELHSDLARAYYLAGELDSAEATLIEGLKISPYSLVLKENLEMVRREKGL